MPNTPIDNDVLVKELAGELDKTQEMVNRSGESRMGFQPKTTAEEHDFMPKAIRIKGKLIAQNELKAVQEKLNETLEDLAKTYDFQNDAERTRFNIEMKKKFGQFQNQMIQAGAQLEQNSRDRMLAAEEEEKLVGTFANSIGGAVALGVLRGGKSRKQEAQDFRSEWVEPGSIQYTAGGPSPSPTPTPTPQLPGAQGVQDFFRSQRRPGWTATGKKTS